MPLEASLGRYNYTHIALPWKHIAPMLFSICYQREPLRDFIVPAGKTPNEMVSHSLPQLALPILHPILDICGFTAEEVVAPNIHACMCTHIHTLANKN